MLTPTPKELKSINASMKKLRAIAPRENFESRVARIEGILGYPLPPQYKYWLSICGECHVEPLMMSFYADCFQKDQRFVQHHKSDIAQVLDVLHWLREHGIPLVGDGCGNFYMIMVKHPMQPIVFVEATCADEVSHVVASSLERFLSLLCKTVKHPDQEMAWCKKEFLFEHDPALERCSDIPYIWSDEPGNS